MNCLILSNSAPGYHRFFNKAATELAARGHSVDFAVDSVYSRDMNELEGLGMPVHDFSTFLAEFDERPEVILSRYGHWPLNAALLSDFERADVYKFGGGRSTAYYHRLQAALLVFFERLFGAARIDLVLYENVSNGFAHHAWIVAKQMGIAYCGLVGSRLPGRFAVVDDPQGEHENYAPIVAAIRSGERAVAPAVRDWCAHYLANLEQIVPDYMHFNNLDNLDLAGRYMTGAKLEKLSLILRHSRDNHELAFQIGNPLRLSWQMVWRNIRRKLKIKGIQRYYSAPMAGENYLLYPLHFHPESSTSILAGTYLDEYEVIRNIAFSLPVGMMLYVKDHRSAYGYPTRAFYRRLADLPNVRILSPFADTKALIRASAAVITLTSTVGYEALMLGRRVFLFGSVFYQFHPNVVPVENPADLFALFTRHLNAPLPVGADYNADFVAAYYLGTYEGVLNFSLGDAAAERLVGQVLSQLLPVFARATQASRQLAEQ